MSWLICAFTFSTSVHVAASTNISTDFHDILSPSKTNLLKCCLDS